MPKASIQTSNPLLFKKCVLIIIQKKKESPPNKGPGSGRNEFFPVKLCPANDGFLLCKKTKRKWLLRCEFFCLSSVLPQKVDMVRFALIVERHMGQMVLTHSCVLAPVFSSERRAAKFRNTTTTNKLKEEERHRV